MQPRIKIEGYILGNVYFKVVICYARLSSREKQPERFCCAFGILNGFKERIWKSNSFAVELVLHLTDCRVKRYSFNVSVFFFIY